MIISGFNRILFIILIIFTIIISDSCNSTEKNDHKPLSETDQKEIINNKSTTDKTTTVLEANPVNTTIFNKNRDVWGWHTGDYIILKWNPEKYSNFIVYRKTESDSEWKKIVDKKISRNEFFDNRIKDHKILRYRIVAVDRNNKPVHTYE